MEVAKFLGVGNIQRQYQDTHAKLLSPIVQPFMNVARASSSTEQVRNDKKVADHLAACALAWVLLEADPAICIVQPEPKALLVLQTNSELSQHAEPAPQHWQYLAWLSDVGTSLIAPVLCSSVWLPTHEAV